MRPFAAFRGKRRVRPRRARVRHEFMDEIDDWWVVAFPISEAKEK